MTVHTSKQVVIALREAVAEDEQFVIELINEALEPYYNGDHRAHARRIFSTHLAGGLDTKGHFSREQRMFIATANGVPAGVLHLVGKKQGTYKISPIIVDRRFRGVHGIGRLMITHAEEYARSQHARMIYGTVADKNLSALHFFFRNNYLVAGTSESHYKPGVNEFMLYKPLIGEDILSRFDAQSISVIPFEESHAAEARALMLDLLPQHFHGVDDGWVDALFNGHTRRDTYDVNEKYKLIFVAIDSDQTVLGVAGATPKKGEPIKVMPIVARTLPAFAAMLSDLPNLLQGYGHKLYTHQVPSPDQVMALQRMGWKLDCMLPNAYHDLYTTQQWSISYGAMFMRKMRVKNHLLQQIKSGRKRLEVRVGYDNIRRISVGDKIELLSQTNSQVVRVKSIRTYETLLSLGANEDLQLIVPDVPSNESLAFLARIYPPDKQKLGIYVFELELA